MGLNAVIKAACSLASLPWSLVAGAGDALAVAAGARHTPASQMRSPLQSVSLPQAAGAAGVAPAVLACGAGGGSEGVQAVSKRARAAVQTKCVMA